MQPSLRAERSRVKRTEMNPRSARSTDAKPCEFR
jgi:hypothetical protein